MNSSAPQHGSIQSPLFSTSVVNIVPVEMSGFDDRHLPSSPFPSGSMDSSNSTFRILDSVESDNDAAPSPASNQILLTPLAGEQERREEGGSKAMASPDQSEREPYPSPAPVAKPRTLHMATISETHPDLNSSSLSWRASGEGTPPTPRPRPRSGEQLRQKVNELETKVSEKEAELHEVRRRVYELEEARDRGRGDSDELQRVRSESVSLKRRVRETESVLVKKEDILKRRESRIAGLEGELGALKDPRDLKKRTEVRLNEAIGRIRELEKELDFLRKEREGYERERGENLAAIESLEREKIERERQLERERRQREEERETHRAEVGELRSEVDRLETEKTVTEAQELQQKETEREELGKEVERLRGALREREGQLEQERERNRQEREQRQTWEVEREQLQTQHQEQCESLQRRLSETESEINGLQQQLTATSSGRETAELALKTEQASTMKLRHDCGDLRQTCEDYTTEINSLLRDLDQQSSNLGSLEGERDRLKQQLADLREKEGRWEKRRKELEMREKSLETQRDSLQNRQEIMDFQLKQYQCDFEEERKAREEMSKIMHHLEARDKDCVDQIAQLRKHVNELSTEKNDLAFQLDQLRQEQQQQ